MKNFIYQFNAGTDEEPILIDKEIECPDTAYEVMLAIVEKEAVNGEYTVETIEDEPTEPTEAERITELEEALELLLSGVTE